MQDLKVLYCIFAEKYPYSVARACGTPAGLRNIWLRKRALLCKYQFEEGPLKVRKSKKIPQLFQRVKEGRNLKKNLKKPYTIEKRPNGEITIPKSKHSTNFLFSRWHSPIRELLKKSVPQYLEDALRMSSNWPNISFF